jgi:hypothetical protein
VVDDYGRSEQLAAPSLGQKKLGNKKIALASQNVIKNRKLWENLITCFPLIHGPHRK